MTFCILEKDEKTFEYFKRYAQALDKGRACIELDNAIQSQEIRDHLDRNGKTYDDVAEKIRWVQENGKAFRSYLNTIKLAYVTCKVMEKDWQTLDFEEFARIEAHINSLQSVIGTIY